MEHLQGSPKAMTLQPVGTAGNGDASRVWKGSVIKMYSCTIQDAYVYIALLRTRRRAFFIKYSGGFRPPYKNTEEVRVMSKVSLTEELALVRKPLDFTTGEEVTVSRFAFFPGTQLPAGEPEIVVKAYDSLHFQYPDTAMFMRNADIKDKETIVKQWKELGEPTLIVACMKAFKKFREEIPEIPVISFYEKMLDMGISGGCNSVDFIVLDPEEAADEEKTKEAVRELADGMGVKIHGTDEEGFPYLVYSMSKRDELKNSGKDAVHILELIYGMGASNTHMIHEHDHDHDDGCSSCGEPAPAAEAECDGNCASCSAACGLKPTPPAPLPTEEEKLQNLKELKQVMLALYWNEM